MKEICTSPHTITMCWGIIVYVSSIYNFPKRCFFRHIDPENEITFAQFKIRKVLIFYILNIDREPDSHKSASWRYIMRNLSYINIEDSDLPLNFFFVKIMFKSSPWISVFDLIFSFFINYSLILKIASSILKNSILFLMSSIDKDYNKKRI